MGLLSKLFSPFKKRRVRAVSTTLEKDNRVDQSGAVGRFAAAQTNRLNRSHWERAHGQSINNDLAMYLSTLQARCQYEYASNPLFEGVCNTLGDDVTGRDGPLLQIDCDSDKFAREVENAWWEVFNSPDPSGRFGGVEIMRTWVLSLLLAGSYVNVNSSVRRSGTPVTFGWRSVHPRRLVTPPEFSGDPMVAFGCRSNADGAPIEYYIDSARQLGPYTQAGVNFQTYQAAAVQHCYIPIEGEQLTGYPLMTSTLETAADIRDYDKLVMEAAKNAAGHAVGLQASHPEFVTDPEPISTDTYPMSPGEVNVAPPGWAWASLQATQPAAQYVEFRRERSAELGRPLHMPLLVVLLTAAEANFSSAQYEGAVYTEGVRKLQGFIERRSMNKFLIDGVIAEVGLRGMARVPRDFEAVWTWNVPPHANIEKFVRAIETMVKMGLVAPSQAAAMLGQDWDYVVSARKKCKQDLEEAELPPTPTDTEGMNPEPGEPDEPPAPRKSRARFSFAS